MVTVPLGGWDHPLPRTAAQLEVDGHGVAADQPVVLPPKPLSGAAYLDLPRPPPAPRVGGRRRRAQLHVRRIAAARSTRCGTRRSRRSPNASATSASSASASRCGARRRPRLLLRSDLNSVITWRRAPGHDDQFALGAPAIERLDGFGGVVQRKALRDERAQLALIVPLREELKIGEVGSGSWRPRLPRIHPLAAPIACTQTRPRRAAAGGRAVARLTQRAVLEQRQVERHFGDRAGRQSRSRGSACPSPCFGSRARL